MSGILTISGQTERDTLVRGWQICVSREPDGSYALSTSVQHAHAPVKVVQQYTVGASALSACVSTAAALEHLWLAQWGIEYGDIQVSVAPHAAMALNLPDSEHPFDIQLRTSSPFNAKCRVEYANRVVSLPQTTPATALEAAVQVTLVKNDIPWDLRDSAALSTLDNLHPTGRVHMRTEGNPAGGSAQVSVTSSSATRTARIRASGELKYRYSLTRPTCSEAFAECIRLADIILRARFGGATEVRLS